jgi:2-polyprenyl-6-methoxyphenol hydroxylase-like FAD-dependent oxidoreductase
MMITILGGGIAGLTTAIALKQRGYDVEIFEAAPQLQPVGAGLGLGANAIKALEKLGIEKGIINAGRKLPAFSFYNHKGTLLNTTNTDVLSQKYGLDNFTIHRAALHQQLLSYLTDVQLYLNKKAIGFSNSGDDTIVKFADGTEHKAQYLIVADGIHSAIRKQLLPNVAPQYAGYVCWRGVIDSSGMLINEASETFGPRGRFGLVPLANNQLYWFACTNASLNSSTHKAYTINDLQKNFANYRKPIEEVLAKTNNNQLIYGEIADLPPLEKFAYGNILLIGDAAHATTPNMGQGACQAIEDAVVLATEMGKATHIPTAFKNYENKRRERTRYITLQSRKIGQVAQWQNPVLGLLRDTLMKSLPESIRMKQFDKLYAVEF